MPAGLMEDAVATLIDMMAPGSGPDADLDRVVDEVRRNDRAHLGQVYDAFRESLVFQQLIMADPLVAAARQMVGATRVHAPFQHAVFRMDLAGEAWRGFGWHQDFPYNVLSNRFVTAWLPLTPAGPANGSIQAAPDLSDRLYPVDIRFKRDGEGRRLATRDAFIAEHLQAGFDADAQTLILEPGDVALFHNRLVHRSGFNPGPRHRFSVQVRFGDLLAPEMLARGWRNRRVDGFETFKSIHPELIHSEEQP
jgi:ectoine hydroxylase-related dioxygenase (phytanoyl-CoA dioxygenase family)